MSKSEIPLILTREEIDEYLSERVSAGLAQSAVSKYRSVLTHLYDWLGEDLVVTAERLQEWRKEMESCDYAKITVQRYVSVVNTFLRNNDYPHLCIPKPVRNDITGQTFGQLTVLYITDKKYRNGSVWHCRCKCGNEVDVPSVLLMNMNTTSCGCLKGAHFKYTNRYVDGTALRQSIREDSLSSRTASGYTGVYAKGDKWIARIMYKGVLYSLGAYSTVEEAAKARANAKEAIVEDAQRLYEETDYLFANPPAKPQKPPQKPRQELYPKKDKSARRKDNTSGHPGVMLYKGKWMANIAYKGTRYILGYYEDIETAISVRQLAEQYIATENIEQLTTIAKRCFSY